MSDKLNKPVYKLKNITRINYRDKELAFVDEYKDETTDIFVGNDNEQDVLNTQLAVINKIIHLLRRGSLYTSKYQLSGDPVCEPFYERCENRLGGWACTMDILIENDISIC